jgi:type VI secretion system protein ImpG
MNREFLDHYNRELSLLNEHAAEFAAEYPGVAERLGGLVEDRQDPMIAGLLQGAAFLAARVQLKLKHEFPEFTSNLLEQLLPHALAPTPSALLARIVPPYGDPALREGSPVPRGSYLDATYRERERRVACRYRLTSDVTLWPFELTGAEYYATPGPLQALGAAPGASTAAGLRLTLTHRTAQRQEDEPADAAGSPETWFSGCRMAELPVHLLGSEADAIALYEQLFADCTGIYVRFLDGFGDPVVIRVPDDSLRQIGFRPEDALLPGDPRVFRGFDLLREYFLFPRKFLGFSLGNLGRAFAAAKTRTIDVLFAFDEANTRLQAAVQPSLFALYAAPAVNLFEMSVDRIPVRRNQHEYHVVPDRSRPLDYEPHRLLDVYAHFLGGREKVRVEPLYSVSRAGGAKRDLFHTVRRMPRRRSAEERRFGSASDYTGTDLFVSLAEPGGLEDEPVAELSARALCSNRHLPEHLPVGDGGADFRLIDNTTLDVMCVAGPTPPREPILRHLRGRTETAATGEVAWRLVSMLSVNHLGLVERGAGRNGQALREILSLFGDTSDSATERKIRGVRGIDSRAIVRRVRQRTGIGAARGIEVSVTVDERAFEGSGAFLLGAVLDRFFAEYAAMNHFTQTVIRSVERGEIVRWPARAGARGPL